MATICWALGTILFFVVVTGLLIVHLQTAGNTGSAVFIGMLGAVVFAKSCATNDSPVPNPVVSMDQ
jgi:hypothetical protein